MSDNPNKTEIFEINPVILNSPNGYSALIDGDNFMVVSHLFGEGFNRRNERINIIKEEGFVLVNGQRTVSGKFEGLSDMQLYQLVIAGVVVLNTRQIADFRKKFFSSAASQFERTNKK